MRLVELREILFMFLSFYINKAMTQNLDEQPDEEIHRVRPGGSECRSFCSYGVGVHQTMSMCSLTSKLPKS
jgi:hypothetical protein